MPPKRFLKFFNVFLFFLVLASAANKNDGLNWTMNESLISFVFVKRYSLSSLSLLFVQFFGDFFFCLEEQRHISQPRPLIHTHTHTRKRLAAEKKLMAASLLSLIGSGFFFFPLVFFRFTMKVTDYHDTLYQPNLVDDDEKENLIPKMHNISRVKIQRVINEDETSLSNVQHFVGFSFILQWMYHFWDFQLVGVNGKESRPITGTLKGLEHEVKMARFTGLARQSKKVIMNDRILQSYLSMKFYRYLLCSSL